MKAIAPPLPAGASGRSSLSRSAGGGPAGERYFRLLQRWVRFARRHLHRSPDDPRWSYYGSGESGWGMQTTQKAAFAFAVVATDEEYDPALTGVSREALLEEAVSMLRFTLASHRSGPSCCIDLSQWGHTWISVLGLERSFPLFRLLDPYLTRADRENIRAMLVSEAQWLLHEYPLAAGLVENNHPEANLWNASLLWKVVHLYPEAFDVEAVRQKVSALVRHGFSTPASLAALDPALLAADGPDLEANFFDSLALHHHRYLNTGYIAICLSQVAFLHYTCKELVLPEPEGWRTNIRPAWELLRKLTFPDGRLGRIGGDTRVRYCYCQDYHTLGWHLAADLWADSAAAGFQHRWIETLEKECAGNGDGSFLSARSEELIRTSPVYYHRLESDRAVALAFSRYWQRTGQSRFPAPPARLSSPAEADWSDAFHGAYFVRTPESFISWVWRSAEPPQGLFVPLQDSSLAEWRMNLAGEVTASGRRNEQVVEQFHGASWPGGFATAGSVIHTSDGWIAEGQLPARLARQTTACVVWESSLFLLQFCTALRRCTLESVKGIHLNVPNDLFNSGRRTYEAEGMCFESRLEGRSPEEVAFPGRTLSIDQSLTVTLLHGNDGLSLHRPPRRNINLKLYRERDLPANPGTLMSESVCSPLRLKSVAVEKGEILYDLSCRLTTGSGEPEGERAEAIPACQLPEGIRGVRLLRHGRTVLMILLNVGTEPVVIPLAALKDRPGLLLALSSGSQPGCERLELAATGIAVFALCASA